MKRSQVLAISVLALMLLSVAPVQQAAAQAPFTEKLSVYIAGNDALWFFTFGGVNASSKLSSFEGTPGLSWYNVTMASAPGWQSDFQEFGPQGYGLYPAPFISSQAMFLTVGSDSYADASSAASNLGSYLVTSFTSLTNGTGSYTFYSSVSFNALASATLLNSLPTSQGGFARAVTKSGLESTAAPFVVLGGQKGSSGFDHTLTVGSIAPSAVSAGRPSVLGYFGNGVVASLSASSHSTSSVIQVNVLDGIVLSSDSAVVKNVESKFTGSYALTLAPGKKITGVNMTVAQQPAPLVAYRTVDVGVLRTNDFLAVTLNLKNLAANEAITKISFSDNWWNNTGVFTLLPHSNYTVPSGGLAGGGAITPVYRLQYTGTTAGTITIPASTIRYSYTLGGKTFNATTRLNPIRLSLGQDDAVVYTTVTPVSGLGGPVGGIQKLNITAVNVGTLPASAVFIAGHSISGLAAKSGTSVGGSATVTVSVKATGILAVNSTTSYETTYQDPAGASLNATSNIFPVVFSHASMKLGDPALTVGAQLATLRTGVTNLTLSFTASNPGPVNVTSFAATATLPAGIGCGAISGKAVATKGLTCSSGVLTIAFPVINASSSLIAYMKYNLTTASNYLLPPIQFTSGTAGTNASGRSNPLAIPAGLVLKKEFSPAQLFGGMSASVKVTATNNGPLPLYNASIGTSADPFDTPTGSSTLSKSAPALASSGNVSFSYGVNTFQVSGNQTGSVVNARFFFGGISFSVSGAGPRVTVYQPIYVSISTIPSAPEEGKNFTIVIKITNPTGVEVSNVEFTLPVPSGLSLSDLRNLAVSGGVLTLSPGTMQAHSTANATASAVASSGITIPFEKAKLTFEYGGTTINGVTPFKTGIGIAENVTTRYVIPTAIILLAVLGVAFYVRMKARPSVPAAQK